MKKKKIKAWAIMWKDDNTIAEIYSDKEETKKMYKYFRKGQVKIIECEIHYNLSK